MLSAQTLTQILNAALQKLWTNEVSLFVDTNGKPRTIHERTIVAKLLHYLYCESQKYPAYIDNKLTWDFEYNRQPNNTTNPPKIKRIETTNLCQENSLKWKRIFPDLILHERNTNNNCCVIEVKCNPSGALNKKNLLKDYHTLIGMLKTHNYQYAISLIISNKDANLTWFAPEKIEPSLVYINKEQKQSIDATTEHCGKYAIYHGASLPQCAKNALNTLNQIISKGIRL